MAEKSSRELVRAYYESWRGGPQSFDVEAARAVLAPDLLYEGPIVGSRNGVEAFIPGLTRFVQSLRSLRVVQEIYLGDEAAVLYDCELARPAGTHRFAEFFRVEEGRIRELRLLYDATEYRKLG